MGKGTDLIKRHLPAHDSVQRAAAPWMYHALKEWGDGVREYEGSSHNRRIIEYFTAVHNVSPKRDEENRCSAFANWTMLQTGIVGSQVSTAQSWLRWREGLPKSSPLFGAITVFWGGKTRSWQGHVGFYLGTERGRLIVLGGNQRGDQVSVRAYGRGKLLGFRWPPGHVKSDGLIDLEGLGVY